MARSAGGGARQPLSMKKPGKTAAKPAKAVPKATATPDSDRVKRGTRREKSNGQKPSQKAPLVAKSPRSKSDKQAVAAIVLERLLAEYPDAHCELDHRNAFELLCATILSAQCTDARVNMVTPVLFARYPTPFELARANPADVEEI